MFLQKKFLQINVTNRDSWWVVVARFLKANWELFINPWLDGFRLNLTFESIWNYFIGHQRAKHFLVKTIKLINFIFYFYK